MKKLLGLALGVFFTLAACKGEQMDVERIDPRAGHLQGEQPVRIFGSNFRTDIGYTVYFGNRKATSTTILDPKILIVTTPAADKAGDVDITVRADDGNAFRIVKGFRYEDMSGSVVEGLGSTHSKSHDSKLAY